MFYFRSSHCRQETIFLTRVFTARDVRRIYRRYRLDGNTPAQARDRLAYLYAL